MFSLNLQIITSWSQNGCHHPGHCTLTLQHPKQEGREQTLYVYISLCNHAGELPGIVFVLCLIGGDCVIWSLLRAGFKKGRGTRDQIANICWTIKKAREFQKNIYFCFIDYAKASDCVYHNKLWKILKEMVISDHLTCLLRNLYAGQEATVRTGHGTTDWFQIGKGVHQRLYIVTLLIYLLCRVHHEKLWAGRSTNWNQDCQKKYR